MTYPIALLMAVTTGSEDLDLEVGKIFDMDVGREVTHFTTRIDDALTLLPSTTVNFSLSQYGSAGREDTDKAWTCSFSDTKQLMGARAAKEQIRRLRRQHGGFGKLIAGPPRVELEKAISEHFIEFFSYGAATAALAICIAAIHCKNGVQPE